MKSRHLCALAGALATLLSVQAAAQTPGISDDVIRIGLITDLSGVYADYDGAGGAEAVRMAIADLGGKVHGKKIEFLVADHQNKADIAASKAREWFDKDHLDMLIGGTNSATSLAMAVVAAEKKKPFISTGAGTSALTNEHCTPYTIQYTYSTAAMARGTGSAVVKHGGKKWFFIATDYAFGKTLEQETSKVVKADGGTVAGSVRVPLGLADYSSFMLQAQSSGAKVLGLANAGGDFVNSVKAAAEFGVNKTMDVAGLTVLLLDIHALGLNVTQGMYFTVPWYWNKSKESVDWSSRFEQKMKRKPTYMQASDYSAARAYLKAVDSTGTDDGDTIMAWMKSHPVNDFFVTNGVIRADGRMMNDMTLLQVKKPSESTGEWDYHKAIATIKAADLYGPLSESTCPFIKKAS
ncbi:Branched-chain amino acid transport system substrate-binding protein OS=Castellaniella defragrans OX=75697 GN=HNR28_002443 PE=3 SV=1 [Castellaniella defragrans]